MYTKDTLDNGIRVVTEHIPYVNSVSIGVWIANGSRNESLEESGMSHFIEHMLFKGTYKRSSKEIAESIEDIGGQLNAFTGKESTCFYAKVLDSHIDIAIDVLSDMLLNSKISNEDIEKEKGVVLEEISMYEDSPEDLAADLLIKASWPKSSIGYPILGLNDTLKEFNREKILDYMNKHYSPDNTVISVAGNFNREKLFKLLSEKFGSWTNKGINSNYDKPTLNKSTLIKQKDIEQVHICLGLNGIEIGNDDIYTLLAINNIFGGGTSSRLFQRVREEKGLAYSIYSYPSSYKNTGIFSIYAGINMQNFYDAISIIKNKIENLTDKGIDEIQLEKSKEQLKGNYILGLESTSSRMFGIGKSELITNKVHEPAEILQKINDVTMKDVERVIDNVFGDGIISGSIVGKLGKNIDIDGLL